MLIDIHTHIIPFVDDGCKSYEQSIELIKKSIEIGVTHIIATPHQIKNRYEGNIDCILENFKILDQKIKELGLPVKIYLGEEIHHSIKDISEKLSSGSLLTLNGSNIVLLEFSYENKPNDLGEFLYDLNCDGYKVIVAHVERYKWMNMDYINEIHNSGNFIQVNSDSLIGRSGFFAKRFTRKLLKMNLIDFVASDMHYFRPSYLNKALKLFKDKNKINVNIFNL